MSNFNINYFNFKRFGEDYLLTNDTGKFLFLSSSEFGKLMNNDYYDCEELLNKLSERYFLVNKHKELFVSEASMEVRRVKSYLFEGTQLHIFVLTGNCNQKCIYCQASAHIRYLNEKNMSMDTAEKAVDIAFQSPSKNLLFEFQGGEPLLNFKVLKHIVEYTKVKNANGQKNINFNLVSNLIALQEHMLYFLVENNVNICTSIDGNENLHKLNRPCDIPDFYNTIIKNISRVNELYMKNSGLDRRIQAIQTTTRNSLKYPKEIVDEYIALGFNNIFIRPLTPLGFAKNHWNQIGYKPEEFTEFYRTALDYIVELSIQEVNISETYATILLRKILTNSPLNYMELRSPCGGAIGQLAYNYDGDIYTCDEGRMLAESGDDSFKLGNVIKNTYIDLIQNPVTKALCISSCLEILPGCDQCVYNPYCGVCPIYNYVQSGSIFTLMPTNYKCKINKAIIDLLFSKIKIADYKVINVFRRWIEN